ncbi:MAG TPA: hypothetical protein VKD91_20480 [Pyrinomonadaceae bacterium]|nr:hypothetical protein [Pyrinomonadaceae bacterium]
MKRALVAALVVSAASSVQAQISDSLAADRAAREQYVNITRSAVRSLKTSLDTFHLSLDYHGPDRDKYSLYLSVDVLPEKLPANYLRTRISKEQALIIIGHLAGDGFLYRGSINRVKQLVQPKEPYYLLLVQGDRNDAYFEFIPGTAGPNQWHGVVRPTMLEQMKALRAVLTDDAGEMADKLFKALEGQTVGRAGPK